MGLQNALVNSIINWRRSLRIIYRKLILVAHLIISNFDYFGLFGNRNARDKHSGIPQPNYYNSKQEFSAIRQFFSLLWVNDLAIHLQNDNIFNQRFSNFDYDIIVKSYFPTKNSALESVNIAMVWENSYWNPKNTKHQNKFEIYKKSDVLFADMMTNTQGIFKVKRVSPGLIADKVKLFFGELLDCHRDQFVEAQMGKSVIDSLISQDNLFYLDYPEIRAVVNRLGKKQRYYQKMTSVSGKQYDSYFEIPFAIFAKIKNYQKEGKSDFICLASIFNETFNKTNKDQIKSEEIYTCLSNDFLQRDKWQIAKIHMACVDTNEFTFRIHLGQLHYASSIYTTAFVNLSKKDKGWSWFKKDFIDVFSAGLLQIDFLANQTLIDHVQPLAEKIFHLNRKQTVEMIIDTNSKFNILEFDPNIFGKDSFQSDAVTMAKKYYEQIQLYIGFLIWKHSKDLEGRTQQIGKFLYEQLGNKSKKDRFDSIPIKICNDQTTQSLKKIMTNLTYLWVIHHGQTFSLVSVANSFYFVPPMVRSPLSKLNGRSDPLTELQKQKILPPVDIIKDSMTLHKVVTYRSDNDSIVSRWTQLLANNEEWVDFLKNQNSQRQKSQKQQLEVCSFYDFWNRVALENYSINHDRTVNGLFNLHWFLPNQLPISLNV